MSSERRINASRRNGALSQGPKTEAGKRRSSRNNLRHGILANTVVLDDEDKAFFLEFLSTIEADLQPSDQTEIDLVETMAVARWRMRRIWAIEKANIQVEIEKDPTPVHDRATRVALAFRKLSDESRSADLLGRYETRFDRQYYRALNLLLKKRGPVPAPSPTPPDSVSDVQPSPPGGPNADLPFDPNPEIEHTGSEPINESASAPGTASLAQIRRDARQRIRPRSFCGQNILPEFALRRSCGSQGGLCMSPFPLLTHQKHCGAYLRRWSRN